MRTVWSSFWLAESNSNIWRLQTGDLARAYGRAVSESTNDDSGGSMSSPERVFCEGAIAEAAR